AKLSLIIRNERILTPEEGGEVREGDHVYFLAPPERAQALDRFFVDMPPPAAPDPQLVEDFFVSAEVTLGALAEIYGLSVAPAEAAIPLADFFAARLGHDLPEGDTLPVGTIVLVAHTVTDDRVTTVGLQLAEPEGELAASSLRGKLKNVWQRVLALFRS